MPSQPPTESQARRYRLSLPLILAGLLGLLLGWFVSNLAFDVLLAYLQKLGWPEAWMIAYALAHIISFAGAIICVVGIYLLVRYEVAHGELGDGHATISRPQTDGLLGGIRIPPFPWRQIASAASRLGAITRRITNRVLLTVYYYVPGLDYEIAAATGSSDPSVLGAVRDTGTFFWMRFGDAFPGLREPREFTRVSDIAHRMGVLLREPLGAVNGDFTHNPLWWTRGMQDFYLQRWYRLKPHIFLLNEKELKISRIVAIPGRTYSHNYVYVECEPMRSCGLDPEYYTAERNAERLKDFAYVSEEFALYRFRPYRVTEADDGSYERHGVVRKFKHSTDRRVRYLTKYNFLITQCSSPVRVGTRDEGLENFLNACLRGEKTPLDLAQWLSHLPRNAEAEAREQGLA